MTMQEEKKENGDAAAHDTAGSASVSSATPNPKERERQTQALIRSLHDVSSSEFMTPSVGDPYSVARDPHLRLRRTLTPSLNAGLPKYAEAQFMLSRAETTGRRESLHFGVDFDATDGGGKRGGKRFFAMDAYAWGASEADARIRVVTLHGISPGVSRTRWHGLGEILDDDATAGTESRKGVRFVALDWHSIDRSVDDSDNSEFLTCLPKHVMDVSKDDMVDMIQLFGSREKQERCQKICHLLSSGICPRSFDDGGKILRAVIEKGLGWGTTTTPFVLGLKSWSGGLGMRMLAQAHRNGGADDLAFTNSIQGAIIMHPGCFSKQDIVDVMSAGIIPSALFCWAKDDPLVPYGASKMYLDAARDSGSNVKLVTYENGGHHNFDGSDGLPNFDLEVRDWINDL